MQLNPQSFNSFINNIGQNVLYYSSSMCPCRDPRSGSARQDCIQCLGLGYTYSTPINGIIAFSGMSIQKSWQEFGRYELGDLVVTIGSDSSLYDIKLNDKVELINSTISVNKFITHKSLDVLPFSLESIDRVYWLDSDQNEVDSIISINNNEIIWVVNEPSIGTQVSLSGRRHPSYYAYTDYSRDRHHFFGLDLPRNIVLRVNTI